MSSGNEELSCANETTNPIKENPNSENVPDTSKEVITDKEKPEDDELSESTTEDENDKEVTKNVDNSQGPDLNNQIVSKPNRELKLLLALSKEAKLDTNIIHKRKSVEPTNRLSNKPELTGKRRNSTDSTSENIKLDDELSKENSSDVDNQSQHSTSQNATSSEIKTSSSTSEHGNVKEKDSAGTRTNKRKRENLPESNVGGVSEDGKRSKRSSSSSAIIMNNKQKDPFCWRCHHEAATLFCETCPRSFHQKCLKQAISQPHHWICPECVVILKAENLKQRSPAMREMTLEHLCGLLKFALKRMLQVNGCEPFIHPVSEAEFPEYKSYVVQPMDLTCLEKNIKDNVYGSTQAFEADAKWILHNSIIFNSYQSKLTSTAKSIMKICKQEMAEIENCANCYLNANTKKKTWFVEVCPKPHLLVWAKLKGFPYWPAKAMRTNSVGMVDVRFFGAHDRAWVPHKECFLYSVKDPNSNKQKRNDINESIKELNIHIENLKKVYGEFNSSPYRTLLDIDDEVKQLKMLLPRYEPDLKLRNKSTERGTNKQNTNGITSTQNTDANSEQSNSDAEGDETSSIVSNKHSSLSKDNDDEDEDNSESSDKSDSMDKDYEESLKSRGRLKRMNTNKRGVRSGKMRLRPGLSSSTGKLKRTSKSLSYIETRKRQFYDDGDIPKKLSRRNSDQSVKSDSSRFSSISDKINKVDVPENMEITLVNDTTSGALSISENLSIDAESSDDSSDVAIEFKRKPIIQVNISANENAEFTISPPTKSKITDKLMKKLIEPLVESRDVESVKRKISTDTDDVPEKTETDLLLEKFKHQDLTVLEEITELSPDVEIFETTEKLEKSDSSDIQKSTETKRIKSPTKDKSSDSLDTSSDSNNSTLGETTETSSKIKLITSLTSDVSPPIPEVDTEHSTSIETTVTPTSEDNGQVIEEESIDNSPTVEDLELVEKDSAKTNDNLPEFAAVEIEKDKSFSNTTIEMEHNSKTTNGNEINNKEEEMNSTQKKLAEVTDVGEATDKDCDVAISKEQPTHSKSILKNCLNNGKSPERLHNNKMEKDGTEHIDDTFDYNYNNESNLSSVVVKSEPSSDDELSDTEYMELKRKYLSALNISERVPENSKSKRNDLEKQLKPQGKKNVADNLAKVIDDVATHYSRDHENEEITITRVPRKKEVFVKPLSKMQLCKQRARKSFPQPKNVYPVARRDTPRPQKSISIKNIGSVVNNPTKPAETFTSNSGNIMFLTQPPALTNNLTILPPNQPITYSTNMGHPILTMVQHPVGSALGNIFIQQTNLSGQPSTNNVTDVRTETESQNYIPQSGISSRTSTVTSSSNTPICTVESINTTIRSNVSCLAPSSTRLIINTPHSTENVLRPTDIMEEFHTLNSCLPEALSKSVSEIMCRIPPKLKPRPPGPLSTHFDEGLPSTAGPVTSRINSISHRLGDYLRGMLVELLKEIGGNDNHEAEITRLRLENEELKHRHAEEILEIKKNIGSIIRDMQKSIADEKNRVVEETRTTCEAECLKRVEEAKSKQWCANCSKEAQFYCCWNTSYCDYPCQQKHWPKHMSRCTQNIQNSQQLQSTSSTTTSNKQSSQPLVLRPTTAPKGFAAKTLIAKPTKLFVNRSNGNKNSFNFMRPTSTNHITLVESTPGNYELLGNGGPISVGGKFITSFGKMKTTNVISAVSPSNSCSTSVTSTVQKPTVTAQSKSLGTAIQKTTVTASISDEEVE